jgi:hypothetical protein
MGGLNLIADAVQPEHIELRLTMMAPCGEVLRSTDALEEYDKVTNSK